MEVYYDLIDNKGWETNVSIFVNKDQYRIILFILNRKDPYIDTQDTKSDRIAVDLTIKELIICAHLGVHDITCKVQKGYFKHLQCKQTRCVVTIKYSDEYLQLLRIYLSDEYRKNANQDEVCFDTVERYVNIENNLYCLYEADCWFNFKYPDDFNTWLEKQE